MTLASDPVFELDEAEFDPDEEPRTLSTIDEADRAGWVLARIEAEQEEMRELYDRRLQEIRERRDALLATFENRKQWWLTSLERWARAHYAETGNKSVKLPSATTKLTKARTKVDGTTPDNSAPVDLVRVKLEWDKKAAAQRTVPSESPIDQTDDYWVHAAIDTETGEVVSGLTHLVPKVDTTFSVKVEGPF